MSARRPCITLIWRIENFSRCLHQKGHSLVSPCIGLSDEGIAEWEIWVYPRGKQREICIDVDLVRFANEGGMTVECEFSLLAADGTPFFTRKGKQAYGPWEWCVLNFVRRSVVEARKSEFLPQDTLTIQCCVWGSSVHPRGAETHIAHTKITEAGGRDSCKFTDFSKNFTKLELPLASGNEEELPLASGNEEEAPSDETVPSNFLSNVKCVQVNIGLRDTR